MRLLICAGGTGGGVYPAITVLEALGTEKHTVLWVGGHEGMEEDLVTRLGIPYASIEAAGVHGVGLRRLPGNLIKLLKGFFKSCKIIRAFKPDALLFTGGFIAFPMAVAGLRKPSLLYVPDIEPGLAIKALARFSDRIALTTEESMAYFPDKSKLTVTGYPVRPELKNWTHTDALDYFGFDSDIPTLAVTGGSKGARSINMALLEILPKLLDEIQIIHITGHLDWDVIAAQTKYLPADQASRYQAFPYLHEMGAVFAAADLILSRAGASSLGEYPQFALPAILVPYPHAWRYQKINASYLADLGAAVILKDEDLETNLYLQISRLITDREALRRMSASMASIATPDAAERIARLIKDMVGVPKGGRTAW